MLSSVIIILLGTAIYSDDTFNRLLQSKKYSEAIDYADKKMPSESRTVDIWVKLGNANEELNMLEKALACYLVGARIEAKSHDSYAGVARVYNKMKRPENALTYAKKAMECQPAGSGCLEYANACMALNKPADAKEALEKVVSSDPGNAIAGKALAEIYWKANEFNKAIPLLKEAYTSNPNAVDAYRIGKSLSESGKYDSAMYFLKDAISKDPAMLEAELELARMYYQKSKYLASANEYEKLAAKVKFTAIDHYFRAVCNEKMGNSEGSAKSYRAAADAFGNTKSQEALTAHHNVAIFDLEKKNYESALVHLHYVADIDSEGQQVPEINFLLADAYNGAGNLQKAISSLEKALSIDKNNVEAYARLADLYQRNNMPDKAKSVFEKCVSLKPNDPKLYLTLGDYNYKSGKYQDALAYYEKSYLIEKNGLTAAGIANAAFTLGNMQKAQDAAESAVKLNASLVDPRFILYKCYMKSRSYKEAKEQLGYILDKKPAELEYWKGLAECCIKLKDPSRCADADKKIIELDKNNVESRLRLGSFFLSSREDNKALEIYKELSVLAPHNAEVYKNLYILTNNAGDKASALIYLKKYSVLHPNDVSSQKNLGLLYYESKNFDLALDAFRKAAKADPTVKGIYKQYAEIVIAKGLREEMKTVLSLAAIAGEADATMYKTFGSEYKKAGLYDKAIPLYQKASELDPHDIKLVAEIARCHEKVGHVDDAILWYGQELAINPSSIEDFKTLGNLYLKKNKKADAVSAFKKYLESGKGDNAASIQVADYAYSQKNYDEAGRYYSMVTGNESKKADFLLHFGQTCINLKNFKKALELLNQVAILTPQNPEVFRLLYTIAAQDNTQKPEAVGYLAKYLALKPSDAGLQKNLGDLLYDKKDHDGAINAYRKAVSINPSINGVYKRYYELALEKKLPLDIETALNGAFNSGEADASMYVQMGAVFEKKLQYEKAMSYYLKSQQMDPSNNSVISSVARCQMKTGKIGDAIISYMQVIAINPKADEEYKIIGDLYQRQNKPDMSIEYYKKYLDRKPGNAGITMLIAENAFKNRNYEESAKYLASIEKAKIQDVTFLFLFGRACYYTKNFKKCVETLERLHTIEKNGRKIKNLDDAVLLKMLGESYEKIFDNASAIAVYAEYLKLPDVRDPDCAFKIAGMQEAISSKEAAKMYVHNTLRYPNDYRNYYEAARILAKEKATHLKAASMIKKCIAIKDTVPFLWQVLGRFYGESGQTRLE
ncbi:MAG TPA: hypothetical protein DCO75_00960, partial [Fibrobacteres bacterium]|nr:hypothetical protein [Fibrobacterota bacterium]